jgi:hypothetical protein
MKDSITPSLVTAKTRSTNECSGFPHTRCEFLARARRMHGMRLLSIADENHQVT